MASRLSRATAYKKKQTAASKLASLRSRKPSGLAGFNKTGNSNMIKSGSSSRTIKKNIADAMLQEKLED